MKSPAETYGKWGVITGASAGIGRSFADLLAEAGMNLVLVARTPETLEKTANDLQLQYGIETRVVALDLATPHAAETLDAETLDLDVGLLINNAALEQRGSFVRHTPAELRNAIELNIAAPTELGQRFGRRFVRRGGGGLIFVAGSIAHQGVPHLANYAASKAHQLHLAESLHYELRPFGVDVLGLSPGLTRTDMVGRLEKAIRFGRIGMFPLHPKSVAKTALRNLGKRPSVVVGLEYKFFAMLTKRALTRAQGAWLFGTLLKIAFADKSLLDPTKYPIKIDTGQAIRQERSLSRMATEEPALFHQGSVPPATQTRERVES
jgi:short-subunit dehydrogenase